MKKLIVIVGITGNQGGSVAQTFLGESGWHVRGITRNPNKPSSQALKDAGAELVAGDLDNLESLVAAFSGAHVIFGVTDFWQFMDDADTKKLAAEKSILINQAAYHREFQQAKNIIEAAAQSGPNLERFIFSTLSDTKKWSNGEITFNYHFDAKADATKYLIASYPELAKKSAYLQVGFYMSNSKGGFFSPKKQPDGNFLIRLPLAPSPKPLPWVHPPKDTGHYVRGLLDAPAGTTLVGTSKEATLQEFAELWTEILRERGLLGADKQCSVDGSMTVEEFENLIPGGLGREIGETCIYTSKYGFDGGDPEVKEPAQIGINTGKLTSLDSFIRMEDWSSIL